MSQENLGKTEQLRSPEKLRSFDPLASVDMMMFDIQRSGYVLPETRNRVYDEELSYLAEGIDRAARTTFVLKRQGEDLVYFDRGQWRPYVGALLTGMKVAEKEAQTDPRLQFLADRAAGDLQKGYQMVQLKPGEQVVWGSPFPNQQAELYGKDFIRSRGFEVEREMGFLYRAVCLEDGSVVLESQTVDRSDEDAFDAALSAFESDTKINLDALTHAYDMVMNKKYSGPFYAGRKEAEIGENGWSIIRSQKDLIEYFLNGLERIASTYISRSRFELEKVTKEHIYGVWALFKKRIDGEVSLFMQDSQYTQSRYAYIEQQVKQAFNEFATAGRVIVGCGGVIEILFGKESILNASSEDVFISIFSSRSGEDRFGPLAFKCPKGHWNKRPPAKSPKDFLSHCKTCGTSVKC